MSKSKGGIKSKKEKLLQKKNLKTNNNKVVQILSSDDAEEIVDQNIQKRRRVKESHIRIIQEMIDIVPVQSVKYNNFNLQRIRKVEVIEEVEKLEGTLEIVEDEQEKPMKHTNARTLFSYKIQGNEATRYVSDLYLQQRAKKLLEEVAINAALHLKAKDENIQEIGNGDKENEPIDLQQKVVVEKEERKKAMRYFENTLQDDDENRLVKCFRCNQKGHIAKNCIQEKLKLRCLFCLGEHHHHDCNSRACFRCNEIGHVAQECKNNASQCRKCDKRGHMEKQCGTIQFLDYNKFKSDKEFREKYKTEDLKKLKCFKNCVVPFGHFNCHEYDESKVKLYQIYERQLNSSEKRLDQFGDKWRFTEFQDQIGVIQLDRRNNHAPRNDTYGSRKDNHNYRNDNNNHRNDNNNYRHDNNNHRNASNNYRTDSYRNDNRHDNYNNNRTDNYHHQDNRQRNRNNSQHRQHNNNRNRPSNDDNFHHYQNKQNYNRY